VQPWRWKIAAWISSKVLSKLPLSHSLSPASFHDANRPYRVVQHDIDSAAMSSKVEHKIANCTVGLRIGHGQRWSGVIVSPDGWIATCGHGGQMPNDEVTVELPNGQNVAARVSGVNPVTDIALVKIQQQGRWPYAALADSSDLGEGTPCWFIGYPSERNGREPLVRKTKIVHPKETIPSHLIYTDKSYSQFGGDSGGAKYSPLKQINRGNVGRLRAPRSIAAWFTAVRYRKDRSLSGSTSAMSNPSLP
jgi:hypothetical protein